MAQLSNAKCKLSETLTLASPAVVRVVPTRLEIFGNASRFLAGVLFCCCLPRQKHYVGSCSGAIATRTCRLTSRYGTDRLYSSLSRVGPSVAVAVAVAVPPAKNIYSHIRAGIAGTYRYP